MKPLDASESAMGTLFKSMGAGKRLDDIEKETEKRLKSDGLEYSESTVRAMIHGIMSAKSMDKEVPVHLYVVSLWALVKRIRKED